MENNKQRLFVDMDGTLAVFKQVDKLETLYEEGYFVNLAPHRNVVAAVKSLIQDSEFENIEIFILSSVLTDSKYALKEKNAWLDKYLPEIDEKHRIFPPCGNDKKDYIPGGVREDDYLLDDYTRNLKAWQPPARGIKLVNAINDSKKTWEHDRVYYDTAPDELAGDILFMMKDKTYGTSVREKLENIKSNYSPAKTQDASTDYRMKR